MNLNGASYTVSMTGGSFTAATGGNAADRDGTGGSFAFTVKLSKGTNTGSEATSTYAETTCSALPTLLPASSLRRSSITTRNTETMMFLLARTRIF